VKVSLPEIVLFALCGLMFLAPTPAPSPEDPNKPAVVLPEDILDSAEDQVRASLVELLAVYADEDLTDSKFFDAFSAELAREQAKAMLPVSTLIYKSKDLRATAKQIASHTLGAK